METSIIALQLAYHISRERLGRRRLAERIGQGEMVVRIELERMRDAKLIRLLRSGAELTSEGRHHFSGCLQNIRLVNDLKLASLRLDAVNVGAHLSATNVPSAWVLRDEAIREGATAILLFVRTSGSWVFSHNNEPVQILNPLDVDEMEAAFPNANEKDLLMIVSGATRGQAIGGLWRCIRTVQPRVKRDSTSFCCNQRLLSDERWDAVSHKG